jgi:hypothetical protein
VPRRPSQRLNIYPQIFTNLTQVFFPTNPHPRQAVSTPAARKELCRRFWPRARNDEHTRSAL